MKNKKKDLFKTFAKLLLVFAFWILVWFLISEWVGLSLLLPSPLETASALIGMTLQATFWQNIAFSLIRVLLGILISLAIGILLAFLTSFSTILRSLIEPLMNGMKSVPVACFIVLVFLWMDTSSIPVLITSLIVIPIVWSNVSQGIASTDRTLWEVTKIFRFSRTKRLTKLYVPTVYPYFLASCKSALGLAWKAGIAAEVLAPPLFGIGKGIFFAKTDFDSPKLFAWTFVIILLSYVLEKLFVFLVSRLGKTLRLTSGGDAHVDA